MSLVAVSLVALVGASDPLLVGYYNANPLNFGTPDPVTAWASQPYSHIVLGFLMNTPDGSCKSTDPLYSLLSVGNLKDGSVPWGDCKNSWKIQNPALFKAQQARGVKIMLAIGGGSGYYSDVWKSIGTDIGGFLTRVNATIAQIESANGFTIDGIDLDYEDNAALDYQATTTPYDGVDLVVRLSHALAQLRNGRSGFLLSHAPQAMLLCPQSEIDKCGALKCTTPGDPANTTHCPCAKACGPGTRSYLSIMKQVGKEVDFLNVQYYNTRHIGTAGFAIDHVTGLHKEGSVDTAKILFGKPSCLGAPGVAACSNFGYLDPSASAGIITALLGNGIPLGGAMTWEMANEYAFFKNSFGMGEAMKSALAEAWA
jgi:chitinase